MLVCPVCGFKVGWNVGLSGAEEIQEEEEVDGAEGGTVGREGRMMGSFPCFGQ